MGLDNGIIIKNHLEEARKEFPSEYKNEDCVEVCYWRKCWGIRNAIINKFHFSTDCGEFNLDKEDIPVIKKILLEFCNSETWNSKGDSIWEYEEFVDTLIDQIINLKKLLAFWEKYPDLKVKFYDSY